MRHPFPGRLLYGRQARSLQNKESFLRREIARHREADFRRLENGFHVNQVVAREQPCVCNLLVANEGIDACVKCTRTQNPWASEKRTPELMKILLGYGAHAKSTIAELKQIADYFENDEENFPRKLSLEKAKVVREAIRAIEASDEYPELIRIE